MATIMKPDYRRQDLKVIERVLELFRKDHRAWMQGDYYDWRDQINQGDGLSWKCAKLDDDRVCFCLVGALCKAADSKLPEAQIDFRVPGAGELLADVRKHFDWEPGTYQSNLQPHAKDAHMLIDWNDERDREVGEVIDLLSITRTRLATDLITNPDGQ